jgi:transcription-repair coupling factor (superfamily II helicase)
LDDIKTDEELTNFKISIKDRFGPMPPEVLDMIDVVKVRWKAEQIGFEKLSLKNNILRGYFVPANNETYYKSDKFGKVLDYVKKNSKSCNLKEIKGKLILQFDNVNSILEMDKILGGIFAPQPPKGELM